MTESIHQYVIDRLESAKGRWSEVAEDSGVPKRTLEKIARQETKDPGVITVEKLYRYFKRREKRTA